MGLWEATALELHRTRYLPQVELGEEHVAHALVVVLTGAHPPSLRTVPAGPQALEGGPAPRSLGGREIDRRHQPSWEVDRPLPFDGERVAKLTVAGRILGRVDLHS